VMNVLAAAAAVVFIVAGCAPRLSVPPPGGGLPSPQQVLEKVKMTERAASGIQGTAKVSVNAPNGRYVRNVAIIVKRPDRLRIDALPYFGTPDFFLSVKDGILKVFLPGEDHFYIGGSSKENLYSFFKIMLDGEEIIPLLTGALPPDIGAACTYKGAVTENGYRIDSMAGGNVVSSVTVGLEDSTVRRISRYDHGRVTYSVVFGDHRKLGNAVVPYRIDIDMESPRKIHAAIRYSQLQPMESDGEGLFDLPVPEGMQPVIIE
jgi:hypothetical protein